MAISEPTQSGTADRSPPWQGFTDVFRRGYRDIYAIRLSRGLGDVNQGAMAKWQTWVRWLGSAYGPPVLAVIIVMASGAASVRNPHLWLLLLLGTINAGMFAGAVKAWKYGLLRASSLDELLAPCGNRDSLVGIISGGLKHRHQLPMPLAFAAVPWIYLSISESRWLTSEIGLLVLANSTWTLALLGHVSYWIIVPPVLVMRLRKSDELCLRWNDPAHTAGIRTLAEGYAYPAVFLALAAFAVTLPGIVDRPLLGPLLPYLYAWLIGLSLWLVVATQLSLYTIVRRYRLHILDILASDGGFLLGEGDARNLTRQVRNDQEIGTVLSVYGAVATAPGLPYGTGLVVQYAAAVAGSVVGVLVQ